MSHRTRRPRARSTAAFTLPELMTVVVIVGVMVSVAMASMSGYGNAENSAALARSLQLTWMRARAETLADGAQRRLSCSTSATASSCVVQRACLKGMNPDLSSCATQWLDAGDRVLASRHATLWNVTATTDVTTDNSGSAPARFTGTPVVVRPDGTADAATFYVSDRGGRNVGNRYKVYIYAATGMARLVNQW